MGSWLYFLDHLDLLSDGHMLVKDWDNSRAEAENRLAGGALSDETNRTPAVPDSVVDARA